MHCDELKNLLHGYLDGELDLVRSLEIERHLEGCSACAGALRQLEKLRQALQEPALYHRAGPRLRERILLSLPKARTAAAFVRRPSRWIRELARKEGETGGVFSAAPNFAFDLCVSRFRAEAMDGIDLSGWKVAFSGAVCSMSWVWALTTRSPPCWASNVQAAFILGLFRA